MYKQGEKYKNSQKQRRTIVFNSSALKWPVLSPKLNQ